MPVSDFSLKITGDPDPYVAEVGLVVTDVNHPHHGEVIKAMTPVDRLLAGEDVPVGEIQFSADHSLTNVFEVLSEPICPPDYLGELGTRPCDVYEKLKNRAAFSRERVNT